MSLKIQMVSAAVAIILASTAQAAERSQGSVEEVTVFGERIGSTLSEVSRTGSRLGITPLQTPASIEVIDGELVRQRGTLPSSKRSRAQLG